MSYCSSTELKRYLGIPGANTDQDDLLTQLIAAAKDLIDGYCGRTFEADQDETRTFDFNESVNGLYLYFEDDVCSITTITNGDGVEVDSSAYVTEPRNSTPYYAIKLLTAGSVYWTYGTHHENAISVVAKYAYSETAPEAIKQGCIRLAAYLYIQKDNANDLSESIIVANQIITANELPRDVLDFIDSYRSLT